MLSYAKLHRVALVRKEVSSINRVRRIGELGTTLAVTNNRRTPGRNVKILLQLLVTANVVPSTPIRVILMIDALGYSETSVLTRATKRTKSLFIYVYYYFECK
jgi:hypothetical protein